MILLFGGTTEGKMACKILDFINEPYFYSTKTTSNINIEGTVVSGGMDAKQIVVFCKRENIKLIIDAAHPFAVNLHKNIITASKSLQIQTIRVERSYPNLTNSENIRLFNSYAEINKEIKKSSFKNILFLTGVQTIRHFKNLNKKKSCFFRILDTELSREKAKNTGISPEYIFPMQPKNSVPQLLKLTKQLNAELLISKESGTSGFFMCKQKAAEQLNIPLWVVKRPKLPEYNFTVRSEKKFLQTIYLLKKTSLKKKELRTGFTTGVCAMAATKACFIALCNKNFPKSVTVKLPEIGDASFLVFDGKKTDRQASCIVIKDAGDDPDITHAQEIGCKLRFTDLKEIVFKKGKGVGTVTLPGLQLEVGEPAINPQPRKMITDMLEMLFDEHKINTGIEVTPFVPNGEKLAAKTFNKRVGVIGGISILGTTGKVMPYSNKAFLGSIKKQLAVAYESGCKEVVLTSGKRSENAISKQFQHLPPFAFIHFGNLVGETIKLAVAMKMETINIAIMLGKAIKLAEGHLNTHSKNSSFNPIFAAKIAEQCGYSKKITNQIKELTLANAITKLIPPTDKLFYNEINKKCKQTCMDIIPKETKFNLFLLM